VQRFRPIVLRARWRGIADDDFNRSIPISSAKPDLPFEKSSRCRAVAWARKHPLLRGSTRYCGCLFCGQIEDEFLRETAGSNLAIATRLCRTEWPADYPTRQIGNFCSNKCDRSVTHWSEGGTAMTDLSEVPPRLRRDVGLLPLLRLNRGGGGRSPGRSGPRRWPPRLIVRPPPTDDLRP